MNSVRKARAFIAALIAPGDTARTQRSPTRLAYEAGRVNRLDPEFTPGRLGPNTLAEMTLDMTRRRVAWLTDNNPLIAGVKDKLRGKVVGPDGIRLRPNTGSVYLNDQISAGINELAEEVDPHGRLCLAESQEAFFDAWFRAGEVGVMIAADAGPAAAAGRAGGAARQRSARPVIELIDADRLDLSLRGTHQSAPVRQAVELDPASGRPIAYHVLTTHPGDNDYSMPVARVGGRDTLRVPAERMWLAFRARRLGQLRGVPWAVAAVATTRLEESFTEAYLLLAQMAASVSLWFEDVGETPIFSSDPSALIADEHGNPLDGVSPGMVGRFRKGAGPRLLQANLPPPGFEPTERLLHRRLAAALSVPYSVLAADYTQTTFSSARAELLEYRTVFRPMQRFVLRNHTLPWYRAAVDWLLASGRVRTNRLEPRERERLRNDPRLIYNASRIYPGEDWVNPQQEASAAEIELRMGVTSRAHLCEQKGRTLEDVIDEQAEGELYEIRKRAELGLPPRAADTPTPNHTPKDDTARPDPTLDDPLLEDAQTNDLPRDGRSHENRQAAAFVHRVAKSNGHAGALHA